MSETNLIHSQSFSVTVTPLHNNQAPSVSQKFICLVHNWNINVDNTAPRQPREMREKGSDCDYSPWDMARVLFRRRMRADDSFIARARYWVNGR